LLFRYLTPMYPVHHENRGRRGDNNEQCNSPSNFFAD
jgi:hypothetical protein